MEVNNDNPFIEIDEDQNRISSESRHNSHKELKEQLEPIVFTKSFSKEDVKVSEYLENPTDMLDNFNIFRHLFDINDDIPNDIQKNLKTHTCKQIIEEIDKIAKKDLIFKKKLFKTFIYVGRINLHKGKEEFIFEFYLRGIFNQKLKKTFYEFMFNDVTTTKNFEAQKLKERTLILSKLSHEFKNPLLVIREANLNIRDLEDKSLGLYQNNLIIKEKLKKLMFIDSICEYMITLVKDFEVLSSIDNKIDLGYLPKEIILKDFLKDIDLIISALIKKKDKNKQAIFKISVDTNIISIYEDEIRLKQILINLLSNSVKFTDFGSIILKLEVVESSCVKSSSTLCHMSIHDSSGLDTNDFKNKKKLKFSVIDTGKGVNINSDKKLFISVQKDNNLTNSMGTGIGLIIVNNLCKLMKAKIRYDPNLPKGSIFSFILPGEKILNLNNNNIITTTASNKDLNLIKQISNRYNCDNESEMDQKYNSLNKNDLNFVSETKIKPLSTSDLDCRLTSLKAEKERNEMCRKFQDFSTLKFKSNQLIFGNKQIPSQGSKLYCSYPLKEKHDNAARANSSLTNSSDEDTERLEQIQFLGDVKVLPKAMLENYYKNDKESLLSLSSLTNKVINNIEIMVKDVSYEKDYDMALDNKNDINRIFCENENSFLKESKFVRKPYRLATNKKSESSQNLERVNINPLQNPMQNAYSYEFKYSTFDYDKSNLGSTNSKIEKLRILIVDDEFIIRSAIKRVFSNTISEINFQGEFEIIEANDGIECIFLIYLMSIRHEKIDIIVSDETMGFCSGSLCSIIIEKFLYIDTVKNLNFFLSTALNASFNKDKFGSLLKKVYSKPLDKASVIDILRISGVKI